MTWIANRRPTSVDIVLAAALTLASQAEIWMPHVVPGVGEVSGSRPLLTVTTLAMTTPIALRRTFPMSALALAFGAAALQGWLTTPTEGLPTLVALLIASYSSSAYSAPHKVIASAATLLVGTAVLGLVVGDGAFLTIVFGAAWLVGFIAGQYSGELQRMAADNRDLSQRLSEATRLLADAEQRREAGAPPPAPGNLVQLSSRELDVVRAIATGMSNAEIAAHLVISQWTVKTHVASVLRKLGLRDRTQVVVAAYESGLVRPEPPADRH